MNNEMKEQCSMWAILPAKVRYDKRLPDKAKLLYAEIAAKCNTENVCFMFNSTMAKALSTTPRTVTRLLKTLKELGYIEIQVDYSVSNRGRRTVTLTAQPYVFSDGGVDKNVYTGIDKNVQTVSTKMSTPIENNNLKSKPPIVPHEGDGVSGEGKRNKSTAKWKPERFNAFWKFYPPVNGERPAKGRAVSAWDKLRLDDQEIDSMARYLREKKKSELWRRGVAIPYAATFLNQRMWETEKAEPEAAAQVEPEDVREEWT